MNWREELSARYIISAEAIEFIETKIIEKLIEEMPEHCDYFVGERPTLTRIKQQLRAKWLGND